VQTLSDLGILGLGLSLALLAAWLAATMRTLGGRRGATPTPELIGTLTLLSVVVVFGVHSTIDWTWFIPGDAVPALLCAGWLAGRGPLPSVRARNPAAHAPLRERLRAGVRQQMPAARGALALLVVLTAAWAAWQPLRAQNEGDQALALTFAGHLAAARAQGETAAKRDPLSIDPLYDLAVVDTAAGDPARVQDDYERAVQLQPSNPDPWLRLAEFELVRGNPRAALADLGPALYLDPRSPEGIATFLQASTAAQSSG
jgi:tetratricopeptide (TPR) repeat protein